MYLGCNVYVFKFCHLPWFNIKMLSYQYRKSHCGDKTILRPSYLHNWISYTGKMASLYWIRALDVLTTACFLDFICFSVAPVPASPVGVERPSLGGHVDWRAGLPPKCLAEHPGHYTPTPTDSGGWGTAIITPDSKVHGANMGPIWGRQDPGGPHVDPMNLAIWVSNTAVLLWL